MTVLGAALGYRFQIEAGDEALHDFFAAALRHLVCEIGDGPDARISVRRLSNADLEVMVGDRQVYTGPPSPALARVMNVINIGATRTAGADPILHCGVVAVRGRAVLLPGRPGAGKSTTTTALLLRGCAYVSDETGPVTADGLIRPYPKPVVVGRGSWPAVPSAAVGRVEPAGTELDAWWLDPARWGSEIVSDPLPVGAVVVPQYRPGAQLEVEELTRGEATTIMASNTFNLHDHGGAGIERISQLTEGIPLVRVSFGAVADVCDEVLRELVR